MPLKIFKMLNIFLASKSKEEEKLKNCEEWILSFIIKDAIVDSGIRICDTTSDKPFVNIISTKSVIVVLVPVHFAQNKIEL